MQRGRSPARTTLVPGHGPVMTDVTYFDTVIEDCIAKGMSLEETKKAVNLDALRTRI